VVGLFRWNFILSEIGESNTASTVSLTHPRPFFTNNNNTDSNNNNKNGYYNNSKTCRAGPVYTTATPVGISLDGNREAETLFPVLHTHDCFLLLLLLLLLTITTMIIMLKIVASCGLVVLGELHSMGICEAHRPPTVSIDPHRLKPTWGIHINVLRWRTRRDTNSVFRLVHHVYDMNMYIFKVAVVTKQANSE